jgi:hypothetical protein
MNLTCRRACAVVALLAAVTAPAIATELASPAVPAIWSRRAVIVDLTDLPRVYSCDELWYRFRAVLLAIGAQSDSTNIMPYNCTSRSPSVEMQFALPRGLPRAETKLADFRAAEKTVTLQPGQPAPFDASDCELMQQIEDEFLSTLPLTIVSVDTTCRPRRHRPESYRVQLEALAPDTATSRSAGASPLPPAAAVAHPAQVK